MRLTLSIIASCFLLAGTSALAQQAEEEVSPLDNLHWVTGPVKVDITKRAEILIPDGYDHLGPEDTNALLEYWQNPTYGAEIYYVGPVDMQWAATFYYEDTGHIMDDEQIDSDAVLDSIRKDIALTNNERRERGWPELHVVGWQYPPFYEDDSKRLAWAFLLSSEGNKTINYQTRILGRTGVMSATLMTDPETLDTSVDEFLTILEEFTYKPGNHYVEFKEGDKLAAYGLTALIAGGAAAAVAKSGLGKTLFKFLGVAAIAVFGGIAAFFKRLFGRNRV